MAKKEEEKVIAIDYTNMLNKIFVCLVIIICLLLVNTIVLICTSSSSDKEEGTGTVTSDSTEGYDVSMFEQVSVEGAIDLFEKDGTSVLYIGRSDCGACQAFLPSLQEAQTNLGYTTYYLNLYDATSSVVSEKTLTKFLDKLTVTTTATVSGEETTGTFGEAFWGVTPMLVVIKDGKMVDGLLGAYDYDSLAKMLAEHGIGK